MLPLHKPDKAMRKVLTRKDSDKKAILTMTGKKIHYVYLYS